MSGGEALRTTLHVVVVHNIDKKQNRGPAIVGDLSGNVKILKALKREGVTNSVVR